MPYGEYEIQKDKCYYSGIEIIQDCKGIKGCIYKQLQRLQAEYDDLHLSYAGCKTANTGLQEVNQKLEQENNELCKRMAEVTYRVTGGRLSYPNYTLDAIEQAFYDQLEILSDKKSEEYKQALQEIRDIADFKCALPSTELCHCKACDYADNIIDKINEVIGAE